MSFCLCGRIKNVHTIRIIRTGKCVRFYKHWDVVCLQAKVTQPSEDDVPKIKTLLNNYIIDDPLFYCSGIKRNEIEPCMINYLIDKVKEGNSTIAKSVDGSLMGVAINSVTTREEACKLRDLAVNTLHDSSRRVCFFLAHLQLQPRIFEKFDVDNIWQIRLVIDPKFRHHGLSKLLTQASRNTARKLDYGLLRMDCTNYYASKTAHSLGFKCILSTPVNYYQTRDGKSIFKELPAQPHNTVRVYVDDLKGVY